jgi:hypothetical protein
MFLGLPDPLVRGTDSVQDPSTSFIVENYVYVALKSTVINKKT